jgi:hypothetical protein
VVGRRSVSHGGGRQLQGSGPGVIGGSCRAAIWESQYLASPCGRGRGGGAAFGVAVLDNGLESREGGLHAG